MNELRGKDRTFNSLDGTHGEIFVDIQVYGTHLCVCVGGNLFLDFTRALELLLHRSMQPPLIPASNKGGTSHFSSTRQVASGDTNFDPTPPRPGPYLHHDAGIGPLLPHAHVESS